MVCVYWNLKCANANIDSLVALDLLVKRQDPLELKGDERPSLGCQWKKDVGDLAFGDASNLRTRI